MTDAWHCRIGRLRPKAGGDVRLLPSANIEVLPGLGTRLEIPAERVLLGAITAGIAPLVVVGRTPGGEIYAATSCPNGPDTVALLAEGQHIALSQERMQRPVHYGGAA